MQRLIIFASSLAVFAQLQLVHIGAYAQATTNATCFPSYLEWMHNEEGQSPCLVAAYLLSPCSTTGSGGFVPALKDSTSLYNFAGTSLESSACVCSTVTFSMLYACATCQGAELAILPWYIVAENCTTAFIEDYPERISPNTSVPRWAYLDVKQTGGRLDISEAKTIASENQPDATVSGFYDALYPTPSGNGFSPYGGEQFGSESQGVSVGVIVGAAVGGTIGVIAIAAALFFLIRASCRRRRAMRNAASAPSVPLKECGFDDVALTSAARLYNPDDPTTYPPFSAASTSEKAALQQAGGRAWIDYPAAIPWDSAKMIGKPQEARQAASEPVYPGQPEVTV